MIFTLRPGTKLVRSNLHSTGGSVNHRRGSASLPDPSLRFNADLDPIPQLNADPDPHIKVMRVCDPPRFYFESPRHFLWSSAALYVSYILILQSHWISTWMRIQIQLFTLMRIGVRNPCSTHYTVGLNKTRLGPAFILFQIRIKWSFFAYYFLKVHLLIFSKIKNHAEVTKQ